MSDAEHQLHGAGGEVVRLAGVEKRLGKTFCLKVDELVLSRGDRALFLGANGSGKSTLLRILAGALRPDRGKLARPDAVRQLRVAYVPQAGGLYGDLTVADNLAVRRWLHGTGRRRSHGDDQYVRRFGLVPFLDTRGRALSGGYHRLTALAAALGVEPDILILDEPFGDLDERGQEVVRAAIDEISGRLALLVVAMPALVVPFPFTRRFRLKEGVVRCEAC